MKDGNNTLERKEREKGRNIFLKRGHFCESET